MGLPLLKEAFEPIEAAATIPVSTPANDVDGFRLRLRRDALKVEAADLEFRLTSSRQMTAVENAARTYVNVGANVEEVVRDLEEFRSEIYAGIEQLETFIDGFIEQCRSAGEDISKKNLADGRFFRKLSRKTINHLNSFMGTRQKNADRLTFLLADIDPKAKGGPAYSNSEDLLAHLQRLRG